MWWEEVIVEEKSHSVRGVGLESQVKAGTENDTSRSRDCLASETQFGVADITAKQLGPG